MPNHNNTNNILSSNAFSCRRTPLMQKAFHASFLKKGMAAYLVIVLVAFAALSLSNVTILNRGEMTQVIKSEGLIKTDLAARAFYQKFSWQLKCLTYENRPCKDKAYGEKFNFNGVDCELLCYDSEDEKESLDIWILAKSETASRAIFYRVKYQPGLVNNYNKIIPLYSSFYAIDDFPSNRQSPQTPQKILNILKQMNENLKNKSVIVKSIENTNDIKQILQKLNVNAADPAILTRIVDANAEKPQLIALAPPDAQAKKLLTLSALKKTDISMQLASAQQITGGGIGAGGSEDAGPARLMQGANTLPVNPSADSPAINIGAQPPANPAAPDQPPGGQKTSYTNRVAAWAKAGFANLNFGLKRFFGTATEKDKEKANAATEGYLAVAKPNSLSAAIAKKYNETINNNYEKQKENKNK